RDAAEAVVEFGEPLVVGARDERDDLFVREPLRHGTMLRSQNTYGTSVSAPSAYHVPKQTPKTPNAGTSRAMRARSSGRASRRPKLVDRIAIDSAVHDAKSTSATSATTWSWIAASSRTPTPPLPPTP